MSTGICIFTVNVIYRSSTKFFIFLIDNGSVFSIFFISNDTRIKRSSKYVFFLIICRDSIDFNFNSDKIKQLKEYVPPSKLRKENVPLKREKPVISDNKNQAVDISGVERPNSLYYFTKYNDDRESSFINGKYENNLSDLDIVNVTRQVKIMAEFVKKSMNHYWKGYEKCAYGSDSLDPINCQSKNNWGGIGITIIDNLDTLYIFGMKDEYKKAEEWVDKNLKVNEIDKDLLFTDIVHHILGGLLSIYSLTYHEPYKTKAIEIADLLLKIIGNHEFPPVYLYI